MNIIITISGILLTILVIVGIHELGHFVMARICKVKVINFSIGFGKKIINWHDKKGTEFSLSLIPLGGYVRLLDESVAHIASSDLPFAFHQQSFWKKSLIILAGPLFNLLFAFILYWFIFMFGFTTLKPIIGTVIKHSIADNAGVKSNEEIIQVDKRSTLNFMSVIMQATFHVGNKDKLILTTKELNKNIVHTYKLNLKNFKLNDLQPNPLESLGIIPFEPFIPAIIGKIIIKDKNTNPFKIGDQIIKVDQMPINDWFALAKIIAKAPNQTLLFEIKRDTSFFTTKITIPSKQQFLHQYGYLGISPRYQPSNDLLRTVKYGPLPAIAHAFSNTLDFVWLNIVSLEKLLTGKISFQSISGPISIFAAASGSLHQGIISFISFLAFLSIAIGVINILPIPGLDGGQFLLQLISLGRQKPISKSVEMLFLRLGIILLLVLVIKAMTNDILRLWLSR